MSINCYENDFPFCCAVDGPIGGGATATLTVQTTDFVDLVSGGSGVVGTQPNWDGSPVVFNSWAKANWSGFTVNSATLTCSLVANDMVQVDLSVSISGGTDVNSQVYQQCGGPGPHTFNDSKTVALIGGASCPPPI